MPFKLAHCFSFPDPHRGSTVDSAGRPRPPLLPTSNTWRRHCSDVLSSRCDHGCWFLQHWGLADDHICAFIPGGRRQAAAHGQRPCWRSHLMPWGSMVYKKYDIFLNCVPNHEFLRIKLGHRRPCTVTETKYWEHSRSALLRMTMVVVDFLLSEMGWGTLNTYNFKRMIGILAVISIFIYRRWWS